MSDTHDLLILPQSSNSLLIRSDAHSSLVARGRKDALYLMKQRTEPLPDDKPILVPVVVQGALSESKSISPELAKLQKIAEMGNAKAQNDLGVIYEMVQGYPRGPKYYASVFSKLSDLHTPNEKLFRELFSPFISRDYAKAAIWYRKAAEQGFDRAQVNLGILYSTGQGVPLDYAQAAIWFQMAAEQGYARAQCLLGELYSKGQGVPLDFEQAVNWLRKAADQRVRRALFELGLLYSRNGQSRSQNDAEAYYWFYLADASSISLSKQKKNVAAAEDKFIKARRDAASKLSPSERSEVESRANQWLASHSG